MVRTRKISSGKYNTRGVHTSGMYFDSKAEFDRYMQLEAMQSNGLILHLERQPQFRFAHNGIQICRYDADFQYMVAADSRRVVEDVKGQILYPYKLKRKMLAAWYPDAWRDFAEIPSAKIKQWIMRIPEPGEMRPKKP
jgi:hypothetical protein